jgi:4-amino-4-deoxy-L-arabinose transferase-like glycosyltransferase
VLAGALAGAAALVRPAMLLFLPLAVGWLLWTRRPRVAIAMLATTLAVITPWTLRNLGVHDRFVLIASEGGVTFWTGNHPRARGEGDLAANPELKRAELAFRAAHPGLSPEALEPLYYRDALGWIAGHPWDWAKLMGRKVFYSVVPTGPSYAVHSARYRAASIAPYLLLLPLAVLGARRLWRSPTWPVALVLLAGSSILVGLVFFPQERFRMPVIDPLLIVFTAALAGRPES